MLPFSSANGQWTDFLTALFTATTSVCVTGLVVVDTYAHWSFLGQLIIMILVQMGDPQHSDTLLLIQALHGSHDFPPALRV